MNKQPKRSKFTFLISRPICLEIYQTPANYDTTPSREQHLIELDQVDARSLKTVLKTPDIMEKGTKCGAYGQR